MIELELDGPVQYREERLYSPSRIFFDLSKTRATDALRDATLSFDSGPIRQVRIGRHPNTMTRVVLDMADGVRCGSRLAAAPPRLVVTCGDGATPSAAIEPAAATAPTAETPRHQTPPARSRRSVRRTGRCRTERDKRPAPPVAAPAAPSANGRGGFSMARQLGLRVGRIVIDAGHGGRDPGRPGPGYTEATLTLDIALRLEKLLAKEPGVEVVLTRRTDEYVALQERTAIANREGADLFVSIHANASRNPVARGVETYLLNFASTPDAAAVAARENASSTLTMSHLNDLVKQIALNSKLDESRDLARHVQTRHGAEAAGLEPAGPGPRREAGAVCRAGRGVDAERARGGLVPHPHAGRAAARHRRLPAADCRGAARRGPPLPAHAEARRPPTPLTACRWPAASRSTGYNSATIMFGMQPLTPVIVKVVSDPTPQVTVVDVLVDALGLTGLIVAGSFVLGGVVGVLLIVYSRWKAARSDRPGATDHTSLDLSSPPGRRHSGRVYAAGGWAGRRPFLERAGQFRERPDGHAGRPLRLPRLRLLGPRGAGDVEVRPRQPAGELLQEHRRRDRARRTAADVRQVGDLAAQLFAVVVEERHRPGAIAGAVRPSAPPARPTSRASRTAPWSSGRARCRSRR